jgi:1-deoxy-D-xylulose-5-phosphate reductoisomerase
MMYKQIIILGSTGSVGTQALEVVEAHPTAFKVVALVANRNVELLAKQAKQFKPIYVVIGDEDRYDELKDLLEGTGIQVLAGQNAIEEVVQVPEAEIVLTAMVGAAGLKPTISAIKAGKDIALANKETLVIAGEYVMELAKRHGVNILPVDSEHSAIFQCLNGEEQKELEKIILTASGGPFLGWNLADLKAVTVEKALKHPNWSMGAKISIDSASMMNKGLEVIEAKWLFGLNPEQIEVLVHPQSIIHSMVQFCDGSMIAQLGVPDMKLPIQVALAHPKRLPNTFKRMNFMDYPSLTFMAPDLQTFRNLGLAYEALKMGGNMPCILNAANEVAVDAFLKKQIGFLQMSDVIEGTMEAVTFVKSFELENCFETDRMSRDFAAQNVAKRMG